MAAGGAPTSPRPDVRTVRIELSLRSVFSIVAVVLGLWLLARVWQIVLMLVMSAILAGTLNPLVSWLERRRVRRPLAIGAIVVTLVLAVAGLGAVVVPALAAQLASVSKGMPAVQEWLAQVVGQLPFLGGQADLVRQTSPEQVLRPAAAGALPVAMRVAEGIALSLTAVVLSLYLLADRERTVGFLYALLPRRYHLRTARILLDMENIVGGYVRGQAITSGLAAVFTFCLMWLVGAPNALAFAILAAVADTIPFVGAVLILVPAVLATLPLGVGQAVFVLAALLLYQELENRLVIPRVYGRALRLSPAVVIVALLVGGKLLGVVGALLALPLAAGIRVLIEDLRIELPGDAPGEKTEREVEEHAEVEYEARTAGAPAVEAAAVATKLAEQVQTEVRVRSAGDGAPADGDVVPIEERRDPAA